jgi:uncharacterized membrane protein YeaQ/YmgE (transglycosylase-associated protein family)
MLGLIGIAGWVFVGIVVAAVEKSRRGDRGADGTMVTILCLAGAVAGGFVGQAFGWFVFGQPLGFVISAAGAELLLFLYGSRSASRRRGDGLPSPGATPPRAASTVPPHGSIGASFLEAFSWGVLCAAAVAIGGFFAHLIGGRLYPQRYEQIPSDFFFFPLGLVLGFLSGAIARLASPTWNSIRMLGVVALATLAYGGFMFDYARSRAVPARLSVTLEPDPGSAVSCERGGCPESDPPFQWTVQGNVQLQETSGLGATVDAIALGSQEEPRRRSRPLRMLTREEALEDNKFSGPNVRFAGRELAGPHHLRSGEVASYPIRYSYRTRAGDAERTVSIYIEFTDGAGHSSVSAAQWKVR